MDSTDWAMCTITVYHSLSLFLTSPQITICTSATWNPISCNSNHNSSSNTTSPIIITMMHRRWWAVNWMRPRSSIPKMMTSKSSYTYKNWITTSGPHDWLCVCLFCTKKRFSSVTESTTMSSKRYGMHRKKRLKHKLPSQTFDSVSMTISQGPLAPYRPDCPDSDISQAANMTQSGSCILGKGPQDKQVDNPVDSKDAVQGQASLLPFLQYLPLIVLLLCPCHK